MTVRRLHVQMQSHLRPSLLIHSHSRYLACSQKFLPVRELEMLFANRTVIFANGYSSRLGQNICDYTRTHEAGDIALHSNEV